MRDKALGFLDAALADPDKPFFAGIAREPPISYFPSRVLAPPPTPYSADLTILRLRLTAIAPHSHIGAESGGAGPTLFDTPRSHPRHDHLFKDVTLNASRESFNPKEPSGASWVRRLPQLNATHVEYIEEFYRQRLRTLQAVDELVEAVVDRLDKAGVLDHTYIIYTA